MAARKSTKKDRSTVLGDLVDYELLQKIGFPLVFPLMPLGAFVWASAPWDYDPACTYEIEGRKIIRVNSVGTRMDFAELGEDMAASNFCIEGGPYTPSLHGTFIGSKQAINHYLHCQHCYDALEETKESFVKETVSGIGTKEKLLKLI